MHPPLDRPHPDCQDIIAALKACHDDGWAKFLGKCNDTKLEMDFCLKKEKKRLLAVLAKDMPTERKQHEDVIKQAFDKDVTFSEYLKRDPEYQADIAKAKRDKL